jgi:hypothetical protein
MILTEPLHGIVVSVGYADFLDISLTHNLKHLDTCVVVTSPEDKESQRIGGKHGCKVVISRDHERSFGPADNPEFGVKESQKRIFNKGAMIERGLQQAPQAGYRLHFDSDILFPGSMRQRLAAARLDHECIYGVDRFNVTDEVGLNKLLDSQWLSRGFEYHHFLEYPVGNVSIGSRLLLPEQSWVPIGFYQLWHGSQEYAGIYRVRMYPSGENNAAHSDVQWALTFDRDKRVLIPEFLVAHLITSDSGYGSNWNGRKTRRFGEHGKDVAKEMKRRYC